MMSTVENIETFLISVQGIILASSAKEVNSFVILVPYVLTLQRSHFT